MAAEHRVAMGQGSLLRPDDAVAALRIEPWTICKRYSGNMLCVHWARYLSVCYTTASMNFARSALLSLAMVTFVPCLHATTFYISGSLVDGSFLSGTLDVDTISGTATGINLAISAPSSLLFNVVEAQAQTGPTTYQIQAGVAAPLPDFNLILPVASLVGYAGGNICSDTNFAGCDGISDIFFGANTRDVQQGFLTAAPEPSTWALLAGGLTTLLVRRRRAV
jgi:hypothetical protein